jgi:hypothetical protein
VYVPIHRPAASWATEAVAAVLLRPRRHVEAHLVNLPRRHACAAEQEGERRIATDRQQRRRFDRGLAQAAADRAIMPDVLATKTSTGKNVERGDVRPAGRWAASYGTLSSRL